ncbi:MAG: proline--tRNA ligase [Arenicellales bacterium WSBS_2016_MAG_OTU3]
MRTSRFLLATLKETPSDAEILSHQLMLRAGMIRRTASGVYSWLPLGIRVLRKVEAIVREEMNRSGAQEVLMPAVQPAELWQESGRWQSYGPELLRFKDRHQRDFCIGPTHEEVITTLLKSEIRSYKQLPANFYQIQTKFRDEIRPRFGVMRAREFIMKDAYSFDVNEDGMQAAYEIMYSTYERIFARLGLESVAVAADGGTIGGSHSHEFHVLADSGEDGIAMCPDCGFASNVELVKLATPTAQRPAPEHNMQIVDTPNVHSMSELTGFLQVPLEKTVKTLLVEGENGLVALVLRGDHELNAVKVEKIQAIKTPLAMASASAIKKATNTEPGSLGPVALDLPIFVDQDAAVLADFVCGANQHDKHLINVNWGRDLPEAQVIDMRKSVEGDPCPNNAGEKIRIRRGIEVGHVFQLGTQYSESLKATCLDENGNRVPMYMGCYGVGVTRVIAAAIEQNNDDKGIVWPANIAPFDVCIVPIGMNKSEAVAGAANDLYTRLDDAGVEVLLDDRNERVGVMFADMELIGIPNRIVIGDRGLKEGVVELVNRKTGEEEKISLQAAIEKLTSV